VLYRIFAYRASAAAVTPEDLFDKEFKHEPEEALSTYEIERQNSVQTHIEHYAASHCDPPRSGDGVDCSSLPWETNPQDPGGPFKALREAHRLVRTTSEVDRRTFAGQVWEMLQRPQTAFVRVSKDEMRAYVHARKAAGDPEWLSFLAAADEEWQKYPKPLPLPKDGSEVKKR
jgi:hypothetical protein